MTDKQIRHAFQRGLGRGIIAVREDPERYREQVLWACGRDLSFDPQCEGTKAWYDYELISYYSDTTEFRDMIMRRLREKKPNTGSWSFHHFSELLMYFAEDGDEVAEAALWEKYTELLLILKENKRDGKGKNNIKFNFEAICIALSWNKENYYKIAEDIGSLFLDGSHYDAWDFAWLFVSRPRGFNTGLRRKKAVSQELSAFISGVDALTQNIESRSQPEEERPIPTEGRRLSVYMKHKAPEMAESYAEQYLAETDPDARALALEAFSVCPYPLDPAPILLDADSDRESLRSAAIEALTKIRDPKVRDHAWGHMEDDPQNMLPILIRNYMPEDETFLRKVISELGVDHADKTNWHEIYMDILELFDPDAGVARPPKSLLPIMYESTLCSFCRWTIVRIMGRCRMISGSMWEELIFDSYGRNREYAAAHYKRTASDGH